MKITKEFYTISELEEKLKNAYSPGKVTSLNFQEAYNQILITKLDYDFLKLRCLKYVIIGETSFYASFNNIKFFEVL